jgi:hypothetical protein
LAVAGKTAVQIAVRLNLVPTGALHKSKLQHERAGKNPFKNLSRLEAGEAGVRAIGAAEQPESTSSSLLSSRCGMPFESPTVAATVSQSETSLQSFLDVDDDSDSKSMAVPSRGLGDCRADLFVGIVAITR